MAAPRTKAAPVGSAQWVQSERDQSRQFIDQEVEEFSFSVRNELEWLDEHMGEIFSRNQMNFADVFKTPGKLRGKTPRTARKAGAPRQPLTDIFAPNGQGLQPSAQKTVFYDKVAHFQIAEDTENQSPQHRPASRSKSPQRAGKPGNTDSGYHGMTEDEMENDTQGASTQYASQDTVPSQSLLQGKQQPMRPVLEEVGGSGRLSEGSSFVSAKDGLQSQDIFEERPQPQQEEGSDQGTVPDENAEDPMELNVHDDDAEIQPTAVAQDIVEPTPATDEGPVDEDMMDETAPDASDASSPEKPLARKSSFTFSALPAREPLTAKRSIGMRDSQIDVGRNSVFARSLAGKSMGAATNDAVEAESERSDEARLQSKTSTQLLQERISMLGKAKEPRTSKSIHQSVLGPQVAYPQLPSGEALDTQADDAEVQDVVMQDDVDQVNVEAEDEDDDWIAPVSKPAQHRQVEGFNKDHENQGGSLQRPSMHHKSISASNIPSATKPAQTQDAQRTKAMSVSNPNLTQECHTTTPMGSPAHKKHHDGPLSASRNKLYSVFKSARSIFASSASASAAAKLEAYSQSPSASRSPGRQNDPNVAGVYNMPGAMYSEAQLPPSPSRAGSVFSTLSKSPSRKTRSSTESKRKQEKDMKAAAKAEQELEKAREKERRTAAKQREEERKAAEAEAARMEKEREAEAQAERPATASGEDMPPPPPPKSMLPAGKLRAPGRLAKPTKEMPRAKPAPVSIRVASQSQRMAPLQSSMSAREESAPPAPPPKERPASGLRTASAQGNVRSSTAPNNARVKALEAAARKKELEEKAAQRKAEQKREMERKRAAKAEEDRRIEQEKKAEEQRRAQEVKLAAARQAEKQAAEAKRREQQRHEQERQRQEQARQLEQQRQYEAAQKAKAAHDLAEAIQRERSQAPHQHPRGDVGGTLRQLSKNMATVQPNPAKPPKRVLQQEDEESAHTSQRPGMQRGPASYQQNDAKRRRTNEEEPQEQRNSVMAPPKRPSNMRKETLTKFPHGYSHAPPPASHHPSNMFKATVTAQHQLQHPGKPSHPSQMVQHSNARIPFAENPNPAASSAHHQGYPQPGRDENAYATNNSKFKTPARPAPSKQALKSAVKSSPLYPNGDAIALPDIATDSEDEDDDDSPNASGNQGFRAPSWVASPALRELLTQQQLVDPESVFGPIGELKMEEVFKNGKNGDRLKRFRDRGSSAAWVETGDAVTSAEKRRDMEGRERVVREGGWRYEPGA